METLKKYNRLSSEDYKWVDSKNKEKNIISLKVRSLIKKEVTITGYK